MKSRRRFVVCINNEGYEVSLERNKIYVVVPDRPAEALGDLRVIDESGEDYLFSADRFIAIEIPQALRTSLLRASRIEIEPVPMATSLARRAGGLVAVPAEERPPLTDELTRATLDRIRR